MTIAADRANTTPLQLPLPPVTFDEFIDWYPEQAEFRYELRRGVIIQMPKPRGEHSEVAGFHHEELAFEIRRLNLPYFIPKECVVKLDEYTGYEPDVIVLDRTAIDTEKRWKNESTIENGASIKLAIEVVSTNWQDDYELKMAEYEALGIPEYWIVDYAALGGVRHLGKPKQPTVTVCTLIEGEYETQQFRGDTQIISPTFPELKLTAQRAMNGGQS